MIGTEPEVEGIRIYNKRGESMFSTDKREERTVVDMQAEACYACHEKEHPSSAEKSELYLPAVVHLFGP